MKTGHRSLIFLLTLSYIVPWMLYEISEPLKYPPMASPTPPPSGITPQVDEGKTMYKAPKANATCSCCKKSIIDPDTGKTVNYGGVLYYATEEIPLTSYIICTPCFDSKIKPLLKP